MIILKIIFCTILIFHILASYIRFMMPYWAIYSDIRKDKGRISSLIFFESIFILILLILAWIIDENQFIFNFKDAFIWLVGGFFFLGIHFRGILFFYGLFRRKGTR